MTISSAIYVVPSQGVSLEELEAALDETLAEVAESGFSEAELRRAKTRLVADAIYQRDSQSALARNFGAALTTGLHGGAGHRLAGAHRARARRRGEKGAFIGSTRSAPSPGI